MTKPKDGPDLRKRYVKRSKLEPDHYMPAQIKQIKQGIVDMLESEEAATLSEAADKLGVSKLRVRGWFEADKEFESLVNNAEQIRADRLEKKLYEANNVIGWIFMLKKIRPQYRDNYKFDMVNDNLEKFLEELRKRAKQIDKPVELPKVQETDEVRITPGDTTSVSLPPLQIAERSAVKEERILDKEGRLVAVKRS